MLEIDDTLVNTNTFSEICFFCKHLKNEDPLKRNCKAFPDLIPLEIWQGENNHKTKHPDQDNNIVFEPVDNN
jgi:hypothetical protein